MAKRRSLMIFFLALTVQVIPVQSDLPPDDGTISSGILIFILSTFAFTEICGIPDIAKRNEILQKSFCTGCNARGEEVDIVEVSMHKEIACKTDNCHGHAG